MLNNIFNQFNLEDQIDFYRKQVEPQPIDPTWPLAKQKQVARENFRKQHGCYPLEVNNNAL